jgi:hypothetical protein
MGRQVVYLLDRHILKTVHETRKDEDDNHGVPLVFGRIEGRITQTHFALDDRFRDVWTGLGPAVGERI